MARKRATSGRLEVGPVRRMDRWPRQRSRGGRVRSNEGSSHKDPPDRWQEGGEERGGESGERREKERGVERGVRRKEERVGQRGERRTRRGGWKTQIYGEVQECHGARGLHASVKRCRNKQEEGHGAAAILFRHSSTQVADQVAAYRVVTSAQRVCTAETAGSL